MKIDRMKITVHKDKAGNKLIKNFDGTYQVENNQGKKVSMLEFKKYIKKNPKAKNSFF